MDWKCKCSLRGGILGEGCQVCNTEYAIDLLPQPVELSEALANQGFSQDQADCVVSEIFQPLVGLIVTLNEKIEQLRKEINNG